MSYKSSGLKDRETFLRADRKYKQGYRIRNGAYKHGRRRWTWDEDMLVITATKIPDRILASIMERSVGAIQKRRHTLRKRGHSIDNKAGVSGTSSGPQL